MHPSTPNRDLAFLLHDVARLLRTRADQVVGDFGMTRAQWAVLVRVENTQGLKRSEIADMLDLQPDPPRPPDRPAVRQRPARSAAATPPTGGRSGFPHARGHAGPRSTRVIGEHIMDEVLAGTGPRRDRPDQGPAHHHERQPARRHSERGRRRTKTWNNAMADTVPKFPPDERLLAQDAPAKMSFGQRLRSKMRLILLVIIPLIACGSRPCILPRRRALHLHRQRLCRLHQGADHPGRRRQGEQDHVREGQHVNAGDELFEIDQRPFQIAVPQAGVAAGFDPD